MRLSIYLLVFVVGSGPVAGAGAKDRDRILEEWMEAAQAQLDDPLRPDRLPWWVREDRAAQNPVFGGNIDVRVALANSATGGVRDLLGEGRWRSLDRARFAMQVDALGFRHDPELDQYRKDEIEDTLTRYFVKVAQKRVEGLLRVEERADRYLQKILPARFTEEKRETGREERPERRGLHMSVSPRIDVDDLGYGAKLRFTGLGTKMWKRIDLKAQHWPGDDMVSVGLHFLHSYRRELWVGYDTNDYELGENYRFNYRFSF